MLDQSDVNISHASMSLRQLSFLTLNFLAIPISKPSWFFVFVWASALCMIACGVLFWYWATKSSNIDKLLAEKDVQQQIGEEEDEQQQPYL